MDALTPDRRFFVSLSGTMNAGWFRSGLSASCVWPSDHSVSNHPAGPASLSHATPQRRGFRISRSWLRHYLAGSPHNKAESSSLSLRTGRSPPVASHPLSRRRSYFRLQAGERMPEEDSTSLTKHTRRRTRSGRGLTILSSLVFLRLRGVEKSKSGHGLTYLTLSALLSREGRGEECYAACVSIGPLGQRSLKSPKISLLGQT